MSGVCGAGSLDIRARGGGLLRRRPEGGPFGDVIPSERSPKRERSVSDHPSLKPQSFMRQVVRAALPLGAKALYQAGQGGNEGRGYAEPLP